MPQQLVAANTYGQVVVILTCSEVRLYGAIIGPFKMAQQAQDWIDGFSRQIRGDAKKSVQITTEIQDLWNPA